MTHPVGYAIQLVTHNHFDNIITYHQKLLSYPALWTTGNQWIRQELLKGAHDALHVCNLSWFLVDEATKDQCYSPPSLAQ